MLKTLIGNAAHRLRRSTSPRDGRGQRVVAVIECALNQNARDAGAAQAPAVTGGFVELCLAHGVGMVQLPCPEIACLGWARSRPPGCSIRQALDTASGRACCARLAEQAADRLQAQAAAGCRVLAVVGGNAQSPGCAVHVEGPMLRAESGLLMQAMHAELQRRGMEIPFRGLRDADAELLRQDLAWLRERFTADSRS